MNKNELKKILKPLIKECIKEVIFEEGTLSSIVSEVAQGMGRQTIVETKQVFPTKQQPQYETEEFKADVLESGKVRYEVKLKPLTLPSGKKIKLATTKKEEDVS